MEKDFHCCATCRHFRVVNHEGRVRSTCSRLGYETKPSYKFHCWDPKQRVQAAMLRLRKEQNRP